MTPTEIARAATELVLPQFRLHPQHGHHGAPHWARVALNAAELCEAMGLDPTVPTWFAYLHDSQRADEGHDTEHGPRASVWVKDLWEAGHLSIDTEQLVLLRAATRGHSDGHLLADPVVQVCWDADRLDLLRVGIWPDPHRLCTEAARRPEQLARSNSRAVGIAQPWRKP